MFNCFPVSIQAGNSADSPKNNFERDLVAELAGTLVDFAVNLAGRKANRNVLTMPNQMSDQQRLEMAQDPASSNSMLAMLARDASPAVRTEVIFNASTPWVVLQELANDMDKFIAAQARARLTDAA